VGKSKFPDGTVSEGFKGVLEGTQWQHKEKEKTSHRPILGDWGSEDVPIRKGMNGV